MTEVHDPVMWLVYVVASLRSSLGAFVYMFSFLNFVAYFSALLKSEIIFEHNPRLYSAGSNPLIAQPPTPSATVITWSSLAAASSPPLSLLLAYGMTVTPVLKWFFVIL